jgi:hypothetical protein
MEKHRTDRKEHLTDDEETTTCSVGTSSYQGNFTWRLPDSTGKISLGRSVDPQFLAWALPLHHVITATIKYKKPKMEYYPV